MNEIFKELLLGFITIVSSGIATCLVNILSKYINQLSNKIQDTSKREFLEKAENTIIRCINATNQTYVDSLREQGTFDLDSQKEALTKTLSTALSIIDTKTLGKYVGDVTTWATVYIEDYLRTYTDNKVENNTPKRIGSNNDSIEEMIAYIQNNNN